MLYLGSLYKEYHQVTFLKGVGINVIATDNIKIAICHMINVCEKIIGINKGIVYVVLKNPERIKTNDLGGAVFVFNEKDFTKNDQNNWVSIDSNILPAESIIYDSTYNALKKYEIQIYHCKNENFENLKEQEKINLNELEPFCLQSY